MSFDDFLGTMTKVTDAIRDGAETYDVVMGEDPKTVDVKGQGADVTEPPRTTGVDTTTGTTGGGGDWFKSPVVLVLVGVVVLLVAFK